MKALVTGASSGMGKDMAKYLASLGYDLFVVSRNKEKLESIYKDEKVKVTIIDMDLTSTDNCIKLHEMLKKENIDILINNAGFGDAGKFTKTSLDKELEMIDLNIKALHTLMKLYLQDMIKKDQGQILNVASIAGFMPGPLMETYYATKNYVTSLSEGLREDLRKRKSHVHLSILCPGPVNTNFDEVAGVSFSLKGQSSDWIAKYTIKKLKKKKFYIIPGMSIKVIRIFSRLVPSSFVAKIVYYQQKKKKDV